MGPKAGGDRHRNCGLGRIRARAGCMYATDNLRDWTGTEIGRELEGALGLPVAVENDGNAQAIAEREYGAGRDVDNSSV